MNDSFEEKATVIGYESRQSCVLSDYYLWLLILDNLFIFKMQIFFEKFYSSIQIPNRIYNYIVFISF